MSIQILNNKNFEEESTKEKIGVVNFHAISWCTPCKTLAPLFKQLSEEIKDANFYEVDVESEIELAKKFSIMSVPTIVILKNGQEIVRINGFSNKENLKSAILSKIK